MPERAEIEAKLAEELALEQAEQCIGEELFDIAGVDYGVQCPPERGTCTVDDVVHSCICRSQGECGQGYQCLRGAGCYCTCKPPGAVANVGCGDPTCRSVRIMADPEPRSE